MMSVCYLMLLTSLCWAINNASYQDSMIASLQQQEVAEALFMVSIRGEPKQQIHVPEMYCMCEAKPHK